MNTTQRHPNLAIGIWKFEDTVAREDLIKLAEEWRDGPEGVNYEILCIRKCSRNQFGLCFHYRLHLHEENHTQYLRRTTDLLKRRFGNQLVGWDISSGDIWVIV